MTGTGPTEGSTATQPAQADRDPGTPLARLVRGGSRGIPGVRLGHLVYGHHGRTVRD
ncbi:hypothetical protein CJ469_02809 [Nocardia farcinica]|uniref:hypothetical protein n=1 Tax=Nocardia farcinica TaxID=37329 RepID=UPI000C01B3A8|nr:hypothetical protein [Nocardia farcinica]PFX02362.1 hypothetical protein CJ469_02809 [Nocardia farcinica]PFX09177.1 hypothetical protein CJ468_01811 [Nocardia farcinica]SUE30617.1 Uncharacterised protein [Nocardia farcinica]